MLLNKLTIADLNKDEAKLYLAALELDSSTISELAKKAGVKRTSAYLVIDRLKDKGLISVSKKRNKTLYIAEDPRKLKEMILEKAERIEKMMPELLSFANFIDKKPKIKYYEGKKEMEEIYKDMLRYPDSEILGMFSESYIGRVDDDFIKSYFYPKRVKNKIWVRAILPDNEKTREIIKDDEKILRRSKLISNPNFKMKIDLDVYGKNKVSIVSFEEDLAILIESQKIHDSIKGIFETMWQLLPDK